MKRMTCVAGLAAALSLTILLMPGCKSAGLRERKKGENSPAEGAKGVPDWVTRGSGAFKESKKKKSFYGVGVAIGVRSNSLLRNAADNSARVDLAKVFDTFVTSLAKNYARSVGNFDASREEQLVQTASKAFTNVTVKGMEIVDHYYDQNTGSMYALGRLDMGIFKDAIQKASALGQGFQKYLSANADKAFDETAKKPN